MSVPDIVERELGDEDPATRVSLGGDDELFVTPTRSLVYRSEGLLSDESVEEYSHNADRLTVSEGRRKSKIQLEYAVEGTREFAVPSGRLDDALQPVLAGVLRARGVTDPDERIERAYRFSELTLVITGERLLKHIGSAVWTDEYEDFHFEDVTDLDYEEGSVATGIVLTVDGRGERIKTPNDRFAEVRKRLEASLFGYHNVSSADELSTGEDDPGTGTGTEEDVTSFGSGVDPLETGEHEDQQERPDATPDRGSRATRAETSRPPGEATDREPETEASTDPGRNDGPTRGGTEPAAGSTDAAASTGDDDPLGRSGGSPGDDPLGGSTDAAPRTRDDPGSGATDPGDDRGPGGTVPGGDDRGTDRSDPGGDPLGESTGTGAATGDDPGESSDDTVDRDDGESGDDEFSWGVEPAGVPPEVVDSLDEIREAIERQNELIAEQQRTVQRLVERLDRE